MSTGIEPEAEFRARAIEIGLLEAAIYRLKLSGVKSSGSYAFITNHQPDQAYDKPLITASTQTMGRKLTNAETIALNSRANKVACCRKIARLEDQKKRLPGLHFGPETAPSHKLDDTICQMAVNSDQTLEGMPWEKLTSRSSELEIFLGQPRVCENSCKDSKP